VDADYLHGWADFFMATGDEKTRGRRGKLGCLVIVVALVGAIVGLGIFFGRRQDASMAPCERYAETMVGVIDNCSSGKNRNHSYHIEACERSIDPTPECLDRIRALSCSELEQGLWASDDACRKKASPR
jgi:hypothetical protein